MSIDALPAGTDGGQVVSNTDAAAALAQGSPKSRLVKTSWDMKDQTIDGDGPDDDAREKSFGKGGGEILKGR